MNINMDAAGDDKRAGPANMDLSFYGLRGNAFRLTPDPGLHFSHHGYRAAALAVSQGLAQAEGFIVVSGPPGTGKTTLAEDILNRQRQAGRLCGEVTSTQVGADDLLRLVVFAFGLNMERRNKASLLTALERLFKKKHQPEHPALLIIDEAQNLGPEALEELRLLSNLTSDAEPLLQILLLGQEQLLRQLQQRDCEQLRQHIVCTHQLKPMDASSTREYIAYRLGRVGWLGKPCITGPALQLIHQSTGGVPRNINGFMSRLLWLGAVERTLTLDVSDVKNVLSQFADANLQPTPNALPDPLGLHAVDVTPVLLPLDAAAANALDIPVPPIDSADAASAEAAAQASKLVTLTSRRDVVTREDVSKSPRRDWRQLLLPNMQRAVTAVRDGLQTARNRLGEFLATTRGRCSSTWQRLDQPRLEAFSVTLWRTTRNGWDRFRRQGGALAYGIARRVVQGLLRAKERWWTTGSEGFVTVAATAISFAALMLVMLVIGLGPEPDPAEAVKTGVTLNDEEQRRLLDMVAASRMAALKEYSTTRANEQQEVIDTVATPPQVAAPAVAAVSVQQPQVPATANSGQEVTPAVLTADNAAVGDAASPAAQATPGAAQSGVPTGDSAINVEMYVVELVPDKSLDQIVDPAHLGQMVALTSINDLPPSAAGPAPMQAAEQASELQVAIAPPISEVAPPAAEQPAAAAELNARQPAPETVAAQQRRERIEGLLARADAAMKDSRYTIPAGNSAHGYYQAVLREDPDNRHALAGISEISRTYRELAREKIDGGDLAGAELLVNRGLRVTPDNQRLLHLADEIAQRRAPPKPAPIVGAVAGEPSFTIEDLAPPEPEPEPHPSGFWSRFQIGSGESIFTH